MELDWRAPHPLEIKLNLGDRLRLYWDCVRQHSLQSALQNLRFHPAPTSTPAQGQPTGVVQIEYPGQCTSNGLPLEPMAKWSDSITAKGPGKKMMAREEGRVTLTFEAAGSFFFTSPLEGECDAKWLRVNVVA